MPKDRHPVSDASVCVFRILWPLTGPRGLSPVPKIQEPGADRGRDVSPVAHAVRTSQEAELCSRRKHHVGFVKSLLRIRFVNLNFLDDCGFLGV